MNKESKELMICVQSQRRAAFNRNARYLVFPLFICLCLCSCRDKEEKIIQRPHWYLHVFKFQAVPSGAVIWNVADNMNFWDYSTWRSSMGGVPEDYFRTTMPYVKYVQLMTTAGGNAQRDLFVNPNNRTVKDDYNFSPLIGACRNILRQGLIPHLKLGNVPLKYSTNPDIGGFEVNRRPPDDYNLWHSYIKAMIQSLVNEFGLETVRTWRFGSVTEYENKDWFFYETPAQTRDAFFALYDYTVDALEQVLGKDVCVGAHSMTVTEGLWDERDFIAHCAHGTNFCTGAPGTRLSYLAASHYYARPGVLGMGDNTLSGTIAMLRDAAVKEGLNDLFYGFDEGRILRGSDNKELYPRAVGYTQQAAFDARMYHTMLDENIDYFSHWAYTANYTLPGALSVSAHTSDLFYRMAGAVRLPGTYETGNPENEVGGIAALNQEQNKLYVLFYAYSDVVTQSGEVEISCEITGLEKKSGKLTATLTLISDDTNYFDEYLADRVEAGVTPSDFGWSGESFTITSQELKPAHLKIFQDRMSFYEECSELKPVSEFLDVRNGVLNISVTIPVHGVLLYEIALE